MDKACKQENRQVAKTFGKFKIAKKCRHYYLEWDNSWLGRGMLEHCELRGGTNICGGVVPNCPIDNIRRIENER